MPVKTHVVTIHPLRRSSRGTVYRARVYNTTICDSLTPLFATARVLLKDEGFSPKDKLVMRHRGSEVDCFKPVTIATAAKLMVKGDQFVKFVEFDKGVFA